MTQVSTRQKYTADNGLTTIYTYEGPAEAAQTLFETFQDSVLLGEALNTDKENKDGFSRVTVEYANEDEGAVTEENETWNLVPQDIEKPLRSYDGAVSESVAFNADADQKALEKVRQAWERAEDYTPAGDPSTTYQKHLYRGTTAYTRTGCILRRVIKVAADSDVVAGWSNVDRAQKLEDTGFDETASNNAGIIGSISEMPESDSTKKQWLKRAPQLTPIGDNKYSIVQDWWFAREWSANLYDGDATP